jgi:hypothetical protein
VKELSRSALYVDEKRPIYKIAQDRGVDRLRIQKLLVEAGISPRGHFGPHSRHRHQAIYDLEVGQSIEIDLLRASKRMAEDKGG